MIIHNVGFYLLYYYCGIYFYFDILSGILQVLYQGVAYGKRQHFVFVVVNFSKLLDTN